MALVHGHERRWQLLKLGTTNTLCACVERTTSEQAQVESLLRFIVGGVAHVRPILKFNILWALTKLGNNNNT